MGSSQAVFLSDKILWECLHFLFYVCFLSRMAMFIFECLYIIFCLLHPMITHRFHCQLTILVTHTSRSQTGQCEKSIDIPLCGYVKTVNHIWEVQVKLFPSPVSYCDILVLCSSRKTQLHSVFMQQKTFSPVLISSHQTFGCRVCARSQTSHMSQLLSQVQSC